MANITFVCPAFESLGIGYLSAYLKAAGHETAMVYDPLLFNELAYGKARLYRIFSYVDETCESVIKIIPTSLRFLASLTIMTGLAK